MAVNIHSKLYWVALISCCLSEEVPHSMRNVQKLQGRGQHQEEEHKETPSREGDRRESLHV